VKRTRGTTASVSCTDGQLSPPLPEVTCRQWHKLRLRQTNRLKDWLLIEEEFLKRVQRTLDEQANRRERLSRSVDPLRRRSTNALHNRPMSQPTLPAAFQLARQTSRARGLAPLIRRHTAELSVEEEITVELLRGSPMLIGRLEQLIGENHAIISLEDGSEW
jgi:hypothetical protein